MLPCCSSSLHPSCHFLLCTLLCTLLLILNLLHKFINIWHIATTVSPVFTITLFTVCTLTIMSKREVSTGPTSTLVFSREDLTFNSSSTYVVLSFVCFINLGMSSKSFSTWALTLSLVLNLQSFGNLYYIFK